MARHRTAATPRERGRVALRWALRAAGWLALGAVVGFAAWGALTWAGSGAGIARWVGLAAAAVTSVAAGVSSTLPGPVERPDGTADGPSAS